MLLCSALWDCHPLDRCVPCVHQLLPGATRSGSHSHLCKDLSRYAKVLVKQCLREVLLSILSTFACKTFPMGTPRTAEPVGRVGCFGRVHLLCHQSVSDILAVPEKQM